MSISVATYIYSCLSKRRGPKSASKKQGVGVLITKRHGVEGDEETKEPNPSILNTQGMSHQIPQAPHHMTTENDYQFYIIISPYPEP